jgi:hypothetical protein
MPKDHQLGLAALQPLQLEQAPRASLRTPAAPRRPTFQQYKDKLRDGYIIDDVTSSDPKFVRDTGEQHDPRRIIGVPVKDHRPVEIRTAEWARLGLARETPINWIVPAGSDAYAQVVEHYKHLIADAVGLKREYLQGNFGADYGKPGGDETAIVAYTKSNGNVRVVAWRHRTGKVVRETPGGFEWSKDGRVWSKCPDSVNQQIVHALHDPRAYTPVHEGEALTFEPMLPMWALEANPTRHYRYDIRRHQVELQTKRGEWRPSRYVTLTDLQSNRFVRVA